MNQKFLLKSKTYLMTVVIAMSLSLLFSCQNNESKIISDWQKNQKTVGNLVIDYPMPNTVFPPEIVSPTFIWKDEIENVEKWLISINFSDNDQKINVFTNHSQWRPDSAQWGKIKAHSIKQNTRVSILGVKESRIVSGSSVAISVSKDSVNAPIFYRDVPLPFKHALKNLEEIKYRLGDISEENGSKVLLEGLPVCGNCHSFTGDGKTMAMDVDYANDKGSYVISEIKDETPLTLDKIISWSDYKPEDNVTTFGLLSQISPDGRYVASTVKDRSIFVAKDDLAYSQLFFPIKGIIVIYDRKTKKYFPLPGASNPKYCQSNPSWSPDGKYLIFTRAKAYSSKSIEKYKTAVIPKEAASEFLRGEKEFKYDLYKIPFRNGKGGKAIPIKGASQNNKSNFFPKISPNGKWIVFTQSENFMLLQPDSKLMIIPVEGGEARELICNNSNMNSWHSWSPNGKWLVYSSKEKGPFTQLYLTHIDEKGNSTPPVLLENLILDNRAINIPEFVNIKSESLNKIADEFSDSSYYPLRVGHVALYFNKFDEAIKAYSEAIRLNPEDYALWYTRAVAYKRAGRMLDAISDLNKALDLNQDFIDGYVELAEAYVQMKNYKGAEEYFNKALKLDSKIVAAWSGLGISNAMQKEYKASIKYFNRAIELQPDSADHWTNRAISNRYIGKLNAAANDFNKAIELNPNFILPLKHLGEIYFQHNKYSDAIEVYTKLIKTNPDKFQFYRNRGDAYLRLGKYQLAINDYDQSILIKPDNGDVLLSRGVCKIRNQKYNEAIIDFDECIRLNAEDVEAYYNRADAKFWLRQIMEAIDDLSIAIKINPNFSHAYYKRGIANIELGLMKEACSDLNSAINLGHKDAEKVSEKYCRKFNN